MPSWTFFDYVEKGGRNPIRRWLDRIPAGDGARIDYRLQQMAAMVKWPEKWVSKYQGADEIYEFRIKGYKVQYRPLGTYFGARGYILLAGAIEKGNRIPRSDIETAVRRLGQLRRGDANAVHHQFDDEEDLEKDGG
jgi:phage-related protein